MTVDKDGIQLLGKDGPILDGSVLGETHGITIAEGIQDVTVANFEIRNFDADLVDDPSSGVLVEGHTYNLTLRNNTIHDNAWTGILAADGNDRRLTLQDNHLHDNGFANAFVQDAVGVAIQDNRIESSDQGLILSNSEAASVENNTIREGGNGAIAVTPGLASTDPLRNSIVANNTINGTWDHGIWVLTATNLTLEANAVTVNGTAYTLGVEPGEAVLELSNTGAPTSRDIAYFDAVETFQDGPSDPPESNNTISSIQCELELTCSPNVIEDLFDEALLAEMSPLDTPQDADDADRLATCAGQDASCLRSEFFSDLQRPANTWNVSLEDTSLGPDAHLFFVDAGLRRPGDSFAQSLTTDDLENNWTTITLCRLIVNDTAHPCHLAPQEFTYGLNLDHAPSERPRHDSEWRLLQPSDGVHARFERIHGADATLFKQTTTAHSEQSGPPSPIPIDQVTDSGTESNREHAAGRLQLGCEILLGEDASTTPADCNDPLLANEALAPGVLYCPGTKPDHTEGVHEHLGSESSLLWRWSKDCRDLGAPERVNWTSFLSASETTDLAQEHEQFFNSSETQGREENETDARQVLEQALARHLALSLEGHGMPTLTNETLLANITSTELETGLPLRVLGGPAVSHDGKIYVFALHPPNVLDVELQTQDYDGGDVLVFDPDTGQIRVLQDRLPLPLEDTSAVSTGDAIYLFGGTGRTCPDFGLCLAQRQSIFRFDPITEQVTQLQSTLPYYSRGTAAVWDDRDRPLEGCAGGCAYIFGVGGEVGGNAGQVLQFNPSSGTVRELDAFTPGDPIDAVWTGSEAYVLAERGSVQKLHKFDPPASRESILELNHAEGSRLTWSEGDLLYILGGRSDSDSENRSIGDPLDWVRTFNPSTGSLENLHETRNITLATPTKNPAGATLDDGLTYLLGGSGAAKKIQQFTPAITESTQQQVLANDAENFTAIGLQARPFSQPNVNITDIEIQDNGTWNALNDPPVVVFSPVRVTADVVFGSTNGSTIHKTVQVVLEDRDSGTTNVSAVEYGNTTYAGVTAWDPSNRNYSHDYQNHAPSEKRIHSIPLVNATAENATGEDLGLFGAGLGLPTSARELITCVRELSTGNPNGTTTNLDNATHPGPERLAFEDEVACERLGVNATELRMHAPYAMTLEYREGEDYDTDLSLVDDPTQHITDANDHEANRTLDHARTAHNPTPYEAAVQPVGARLVVTVPHNLTAETQALVLAGLIEEHAGTFGTFAVEIDNLPIPARLAEQIEATVEEKGTIVLVGAGSLPEATWDRTPENKLRTVHGLASHPQVLTIGAGGVDEGLAEWSRRGPAPQTMGPKPDLIAPSPENSTVGAVRHVLPFVEALTVRGVHEVNLVRTVLAGYALPVSTPDGTSATYWGQGVGSVDLSEFLELNTTTELVSNYADRNGLSTLEAKQQLALELGTTTDAINASTPAEIVGAAGKPGAVVRSAVSASLVNLTLNAPALPATSVADYGVVNHEKTKRAYVGAIDLDPLVNATINTTRGLLKEAGYTGTQLDDRMENLTQLFQGVTEGGQEVTTNITHYYYPQFLSEDFLYSTYEKNLNDTLNDTQSLPTGATSSANHALRQRLDDWRLDPHYLVPEQTGTVSLNVTVDERCMARPILGALDVGNAAIEITTAEAQQLLPTRKSPVAAEIEASLPESSSAFLSDKNEDFVKSQGRQLACHEDVKRLLTFLRDRAEDLRGLKSAPMGAWNQTEAVTGNWNQTPLGHQIDNTTDALDRSGETLADNSTLVLDITIEALTRSLELVQQKGKLFETPRITAEEPTSDPRNLTHPPTDPARTQTAKIGPYVGVAQMTSHDVNVTNPFTGDTAFERDVTIPLPSFLWNNPTVTWNEVYRDTSPVPNRNVTLYIPPGAKPGVGVDLPTNFGVKHNSSLPTVNSSEATHVNVSLAVNATHHFSDQLDGLDSILETVRSLSNQTDQTGVFQGVLNETLNRTETELENNVNRTSCLSEGLACPDAFEFRKEFTEDRVNLPLMGMFSHKGNHKRVTDANGDAEFGFLFPSQYKVRVPYAYPMVADANRTVAPTHVGLEWFDGQVNDTRMEVAREADDRIRNLPEHPTAGLEDRQPRPKLPSAIRENTTNPVFSPYVEIHEQDMGVFNPYVVGLSHVDLPGVSCEALRDFSQVTKTPLDAPGCDEPLLPQSVREDLRELRSVARCILGQAHQQLDPGPAQQCETIRKTIDNAREPCEAEDRCLDYNDTQPLRRALENVSRISDQALAEDQDIAFPFAKSPTRALHENKTAVGFTVDNLINRTKELNKDNPDTGNDTNYTRAIEDVLESENLLPVANQTTEATPPPEESTKNHTIAQGVSHRITDRVSGLDWVPYDTQRDVNLTTTAVDDMEDLWQKIKTTIDQARANLDSNPDREEDDEQLINEFQAQLNDTLTDEEAVDAWNQALRFSKENRTGYFDDGFRANGTVSNGAYRLAGDGRLSELSDADRCELKERETQLPEPYYRSCESVNNQLSPSVQGTSKVDTASLANILLEETRRYQNNLTGGGDPLAASTLSDILRKTVALSAGDPDHTVRRTETGILVNKTVDNADPMVGALYYNTPLPINEHLRYQLDGEIYVNNTAALIVTTPSPVVKTALLEAVDNLDLTVTDKSLNETDDPPSDAVLDDTIDTAVNAEAFETGAGQLQAALDLMQSSIQTAADAQRLLERRDPLIRTELVGFPLKVEQKSNLPLVNNVYRGDQGPGVTKDCGTAAPSEPNAETELCEHGLVLAQPDGYYNFSRTYEMYTRKLGDTNHGPSSLHTIVVYLPSSTQDSDPLDQRIVIQNFTEQVDTFTGLNTSNTREDTKYSVPTRIGYRKNVEEFQQYWAVPDQQLAPKGGDGVHVKFSMNDTSIVLNRTGGYTLHEDSTTTRVPGPVAMLDGLGLPIFDSYCPDSNAPGYSSENDTYWPRGVSRTQEPDFQFYGQPQPCSQNAIDALRPVHLANEEDKSDNETASILSVVTNPNKQIADALSYQFHVPQGPGEEFTQSGRAEPGRGAANPLNDPLAMIGSATDRVPPTVESNSVDHWRRQAERVRDAALDTPLYGLQNATPFVHPSWQPSEDEPGGDLKVPLHNVALLNASMAERLMDDPWDPSTVVTRTDESNATLEDQVHEPHRVATSAHHLPERNHSKYMGAVTAHAFRANVNQGTSGDTLAITKQAAVLAGHGVSGTGAAVQVTAEWTENAEDYNESSILQGQHVDTQADLNVSLYKLGGNRTAGSDCQQVPLWPDYAEPYFRCIGWSKAQTDIVVQVDGTNQDCYEETLAVLQNTQQLALDAEDHASQRPHFQPTNPAQHALEALTEDENRSDGSGFAAEPYISTAQVFKNGTNQRGEDVRELTSCLSFESNIDLGLEEPYFFWKSLQWVADNGLDGILEQNILNLTGYVSTDLAQYGEPDHRVEPKLLVEEIIREREATDVTGLHQIDLAIDEWSTLLDTGVLTVVRDNGTETSYIVERYNASEVDTTFEDTFTLDLAHGDVYELNLSVEDNHGHNKSDVVGFVVDDQRPTVSSDLASQLVTGGAEFVAQPRVVDVTWTLEDNTSGLHAIDAAVQQPNDTWISLNTSLDEEDVGSTNATTVTGEVNLTGLVHGEEVKVEATVEDRAGNTRTLMENVSVDANPPTLSGDITNENETRDLITEGLLNSTWTVDEDGPAGLGTVTAHLYNHSSDSYWEISNVSLDVAGSLLASYEASNGTWPNTTYDLVVQARDRVGHVVNQTLDSADVQIVPRVNASIPRFAEQVFNDQFSPRVVNVSLPDFPGVAVEEVRFNVTRAANPSNQTFQATQANVTGAVRAIWNATEATNAAYNVSITAQHGRALRAATFDVQRPEPDSGGHRSVTTQYYNDTSLTRGVLYGTVEGTSNEDVMEASFQNCQDAQTGVFIEVGGLAPGSPDVDLRTAIGDPSTDNRTDWVNSTSSNATESVKREPSSSEVTYTVIVDNDAAETVSYVLSYTVPECREPGPVPGGWFEARILEAEGG